MSLRPSRTDNPHRPALVATRIEATFADRTWSAQTLEGAPCFRAFFVRRGAGVFVAKGSAPFEVTAPLLLWLPYGRRGEFRLLAGSDGATLLADDELVARLVGESPIGSQLRPLVDQPLLAPGGGLKSILPEIETLFSAMTRESRDPGPGAPAMTSYYLGLLILHLWRSCGLARESDALDAGAPTAQRFRQLVELHYRDNLGVDDFAAQLGVTRTHLHNACLRTLGRPPQQLVHERLVLEARLRLRETAQPVEQVGYSLGFRDPAYFNRFFRRLSGMSPGAYRKTSRVASPREMTSFSAWP